MPQELLGESLSISHSTVGRSQEGVGAIGHLGDVDMYGVLVRKVRLEFGSENNATVNSFI